MQAVEFFDGAPRLPSHHPATANAIGNAAGYHESTATSKRAAFTTRKRAATVTACKRAARVGAIEPRHVRDAVARERGQRAH